MKQVKVPKTKIRGCALAGWGCAPESVFYQLAIAGGATSDMSEAAWFDAKWNTIASMTLGELRKSFALTGGRWTLKRALEELHRRGAMI